jgi:hypothetical protein
MEAAKQPELLGSGVAIVRGFAAFDLLVTALLVWPPSARGFVDVLYRVNGYFGGVSTPPFFDSIQLFFVCLAGVLGVLWALVRLVSPSRLLAFLDAGGRVVVSLLILFFVLAGSAPTLLLLFVVTELLGAMAEARVR